VLRAATDQAAGSDDDVTAVVMRVLEQDWASRTSDLRGPQQRIEVVLSPDLGAATTARRLLEQAFGAKLDLTELDRAKLAVSELTTNSVRHGRGDITLRAELDEARLRVEVIDEGPGFARSPRSADPEQVGGWGLDLVEGASTRWGIADGAPHVWFEIQRGEDEAGAGVRQGAASDG
jgi:anti-sigma regulatory factor (Ser/Thr protein kinase)